MGFLDKVKSTAQQAGDKAQKGVKAGRGKVDDARTKKKIEGLQQELGALAYAKHTGTADADFETEVERIVNEITELKTADEEPGDKGGAAESS